MSFSSFKKWASIAMIGGVATLIGVGCGGDDDKGGTTNSTASAITTEDVFDTNDVLLEQGTGAGAIKVGDPAAFLDAARKASNEATGHIRSGVQRIADVISNRNPDKGGTTPAGQPYGVWLGQKDGASFKLVAVKTGPNRVRYVLKGGKSADALKVFLTGVFVKKAPRKGGGRLHLNLTNISDVTGAPNVDGKLHLMFANFKDDAKVRRLRYLNVKAKNAPATVPAIGFSVDFFHNPGKGGRLRTFGLGEYPNTLLGKIPGIKMWGMRVVWGPDGGRGDGVLFTLPPLKKVGEFHECWDKGGLRTAYKDTIQGNEADSPDEGDTKAIGKCGGFNEENVPDASVNENGSDADPQVDTALNDSEASGISEADASVEDDPAP